MTKPPKRHADGEGLFFKTLGKGRAYWTYRFTLKGRETEMSLGAYPEMSLDEARVSHLRLCADVAEGKDPVGERRRNGKAPVLTPSGAPTFGHCADQHIALHEGGWKNSKHHAQWVATLKTYAAPIRETPVDKITTADVLAVLTPIWNDKPETAQPVARSHRGGYCRWRRSMAGYPKTGRTRRGGKIGSTANCPRRRSSAREGITKPWLTISCPLLWRKLAENPGVPALALRITIFTCARTNEALGMTFDEIDLDKRRVVVSRRSA